MSNSVIWLGDVSDDVLCLRDVSDDVSLFAASAALVFVVLILVLVAGGIVSVCLSVRLSVRCTFPHVTSA